MILFAVGALASAILFLACLSVAARADAPAVGKLAGYIQPQPHTRALWDELQAAKAAGDKVAIGKLSAEIRTRTVRGDE